ncbi:hypothetical protein QTL95_00650 [Rhizobium sp. S152]|nr:hypothetical protein [Rhizobium sp. S152]MDM9624384.1 hypothetical protein [Rhizobium sp. S152]
MTKIIGVAAVVTIALAVYAAYLNPYESGRQSGAHSRSDDSHTASIR